MAAKVNPDGADAPPAVDQATAIAVSAMLSDDVDDFLCGDCNSTDNKDADGEDGGEAVCDVKTCFFCMKEPVMVNQMFGANCANDVRGARKDAKHPGKVQ